jgi:hypothetical protein
MIKNIVENLNENKFFIGFMMIIVTIGGRFIINILTDEQKDLINNPIAKKIFIFCAFFMSTRDIQCSIVLTILFILIITELFNGDVNFLNKDHQKEKKYDTITNDKKIDSIIQELNQMKSTFY